MLMQEDSQLNQLWLSSIFLYVIVGLLSSSVLNHAYAGVVSTSSALASCDHSLVASCSFFLSKQYIGHIDCRIYAAVIVR
jgi:hypothetical protein